MHECPYKRELEDQSQRRRCDNKSKGRSGMRKGPHTKECGRPLEAGKGEGMNSHSRSL